MYPSPRIAAACALLALTLATTPLAAAVCGRTNQPGATLLFPFFEVNMVAEEGRTTLISINNADSSPALAHVVLWTNWGVPSLAFDILLGPHDVQTLNLRDVLNGRLPETHLPPVGGAFPSCASPLELPSLDAQALAVLQSMHTGQMSPDDGNCYSTPLGDLFDFRAAGYITVDTMNDCSESIAFPRDEGYFEHGGDGLASNRNVLWGDLFLVDASEDYAQGIEAVSIMADADKYGPDTTFLTFYAEEGTVREDNREPLSHTYRSRFLNGGGFDGGTELLLWHSGFCGPITFGCFGSPIPSDLRQELVVNFRDEAGEPTGEEVRFQLPERVTRLKVGSSWLPVDKNFGQLELHVEGQYEGRPPLPNAQAWVIPIMSAQSRYSLSLNAIQVDGHCE